MGLVINEKENELNMTLSAPLVKKLDLQSETQHLFYVRESTPLLCAIPWLTDARLYGVPVIDERMRVTGTITHDEVLQVMSIMDDDPKRFLQKLRTEEVVTPPLVFNIYDELKRVITEFVERKKLVGVVVNASGFPITTITLCDVVKSLIDCEPLRSLLADVNAISASMRVKKVPMELSVKDVISILTSNGSSAIELDDTHFCVTRVSLVNGLLSSFKLYQFLNHPHQFLNSSVLNDKDVLLPAHRISEKSSILDVGYYLRRVGEEQIVKLNDIHYIGVQSLCFAIGSILLEVSA
ncbi:MAG: CBS domain-containing protein [Thaumarchaeota archaeon]|nr:CBS domain-containing protein [Candidatus Calditenuaceae archaeon]MDW8186806.1 CBS domain-containing protein [Nitrososphaerota archaeon]